MNLNEALAGLPPELAAHAPDVFREHPAIFNRFAQSGDADFWQFTPRPDRPDMFDEQASFCYNQDTIAFNIGGNASGTTEASAWKAAKFMLEIQEAPRKDTPYWIASNTYEQVEDVCWKEKLLGHGHIPASEVDWARIRYSGGHISKIPLLPWAFNSKTGGNWQIELKSFEQGRTALQAKSIGGFWFSEQFPLDRFLETIRGCRDYFFPGSMFCEFTPIDPELSMWVEQIMDEMPEGWRFYRCNTECNRVNLADGWFESFFAAVPDEMRETRMTGALASFEGVIFSGFNIAIHVFDDGLDCSDDIPRGVFHYRGLDWGASIEHPFACVFGYRDGIGDWVIYDEYWSIDQTAITFDHIRAIAEIMERWGYPGHWDDKAEKGGAWRQDQSPHHLECFCDPSRPNEINELAFRGLKGMPAGNDVFKGIDCIRSLLKVNPATGRPRLRIHARCKHLIQEMRKYRWLRGKKPTSGTLLNPKVALPMPLKRDDDTVDGARYMLYSAERGRGAVPGSMSHRDFAAKKTGIQLSAPRYRGDRTARKTAAVFTKEGS